MVPRGRVHLVSLGCPKNSVDGELLLGQLKAGGYSPVASPEEADLIVVNTCAFIKEATEEALETVLEMARWKEVGPCRRLLVAGCLPQRYGEELLELLPEVDLFLGPGEIPRIGERLRALEEGGGRACFRDAQSYLYDGRDPRVRATHGPVAYVKIAEGCSNRCAYCAVPLIRGPLRSRTVTSVVEEARRLAEEGVKELIVVAQDTAAFGLDRSREGELPDLLRALDRVDGLEWIRLLYVHPAHVSDALLDALGEGRRICPYLDIPIQHIAHRILQAMNRQTGSRDLRRLIRRIRESLPQIHLRSSLIVGFPGESEADFQELLDFLEEARFQWVGAFAYSREEGTPAASLGPSPPQRVVEERIRRLMERQMEITQELLSQWVGRSTPVLVEGHHQEAPRSPWGRTAFQAPEIDGVVHLGSEEVIAGQFRRVRITGVLDYDLTGELAPGA
jgi:ribosomal protein S12 methylthiotransferase